jgi:hypothetical protein
MANVVSLTVMVMGLYFLRKIAWGWPSYSERLTQHWAAMSSVSATLLKLIFGHKLKRMTRSGSRMIDHCLPRRLLTGCQDVLEETRFGGFFVASLNVVLRAFIALRWHRLISQST